MIQCRQNQFYVIIMPTLSVLTLTLLLFLFPNSILAEELVVGHLHDPLPRTLELASRETGTITVHLKSAGDPVNDYRVFLIRDVDQKPLQVGRSDDNGLVVFSKIPPGRFSVFLKKTTRQRIETSVSIGDIVLTPSSLEQGTN